MLMSLTVFFLHRDLHDKANAAHTRSERLRWRLLAIALYAFGALEGATYVYLLWQAIAP